MGDILPLPVAPGAGILVPLTAIAGSSLFAVDVVEAAVDVLTAGGPARIPVEREHWLHGEVDQPSFGIHVGEAFPWPHLPSRRTAAVW